MIVYSGNKKKSGGMLRTQYSIEKNDKTKRSELYFFWTIQQQTDYNEKTDTPVFKDGKTKTVKFNRSEVGAMIATYESALSGGKATSWSSFHDGKEKTSISFSYYHKEGTGKFPKDINMFTLRYNVNQEAFQVGISIGDFYIIKNEIDNALSIFSEIEKAELDEERVKYSKDSTKKSNDDDDESDTDATPDSAEEDEDVPF